MNNYPVPRSPSDFRVLASRYIAAIMNFFQDKRSKFKQFNGFVTAFFFLSISTVLAWQLDMFRCEWRHHQSKVVEKSETKEVTKRTVVTQNTEGGQKQNISFDLAPASIKELPEPNVKEFIVKWTKTAIAEMDKFGIPASITMAQGIIESRSGTSIISQPLNFAAFDKRKVLRQGCNNHFGIKCQAKLGVCKPGHCANHMDDYSKDFFVKFAKAEDSWRGHSEFLMKYRYRDLLKFGKNYKAWAKGLRDYGYATDPKYDEKLIAIIEKYELNKLDDL